MSIKSNPSQAQPQGAREHSRSGSEITDAVRTGELQQLTFGMGCFWGPDSRLGAMDGVVQTRVGYSGGPLENPEYRNMPGHAEVVRVVFDPASIGFEALFDVFRTWVTPTKAFGSKYRPLVFAESPDHARIVHDWVMGISDPDFRPQIEDIGAPETRFWDAEAYHQKYRLKKANPDLATALMNEFGPAWDETELATKLNGFEKEALSNARHPLIRSLLGTPEDRHARSAKVATTESVLSGKAPRS